MSGADYTTQGAVAVIRLDHPPVNGLAHAVRAGILAGLDQASADAAVSAVVVIGAGKSFSAGADISELGTPKSLLGPILPTVIREIERSEKPVIAAVHGVAMGGGLELALGCHYRVAAPGTQIRVGARFERYEHADLAQSRRESVVHVSVHDALFNREAPDAAERHVLADGGDHVREFVPDAAAGARDGRARELCQIIARLKRDLGNGADEVLEDVVARDEVGL